MRTRRLIVFFATLCSLALPIQVPGLQTEARQATSEETGAPVEVPNPMLLDVALVGDKVISPADLRKSYRKTYGDMRGFVCRGVSVAKVQVEKESGRRGSVRLHFFVTFRTENFRDKVGVAVTLLANGTAVKEWKNPEMVLGLTVSDVVGRGAMAAVDPVKSRVEEIVFEFESDASLRAVFSGQDPKLRIVVNVID